MLTVSDQRMPESELYIGQLMKQRYKEQETKRERDVLTGYSGILTEKAGRR